MASSGTPTFDARNMPFRTLGPSGLRVPLFSLGGWLTLGQTVKGSAVKEMIKLAFENGINMFDTAEGYNKGESEVQMGHCIKELGYRRSDIIITTKIYYGVRSGPNASGLSRKHVIEGLRESLDRLGMDYVDVVFAHRPDNTVPMEETVRAFNWVIEKGWAFYWGTSEWSAREIEEAHHVADKLGLIAPIAEQCKHHMLHRERPESEFAPLYKKYGYRKTVFSALAMGLLTGKYNEGIPEDSRLATHSEELKSVIEQLNSEQGLAQLQKIRELAEFAKELNCSIAHLALAWVAVNPTTSTVIIGATKPAQLLDNLKALEVIGKLTPAVLDKIDGILGNKPVPHLPVARPPLDQIIEHRF